MAIMHGVPLLIKQWEIEHRARIYLIKLISKSSNIKSFLNHYQIQNL